MRLDTPLRSLAPLIVLPAAVLFMMPADVPRWAFMWTLAVAIFAGCKWLTWSEARDATAPWWLHAGYLLAWPGLDANTFLTFPSRDVVRPKPSEWMAGGLKLVAGIVLFWGIARRVSNAQDVLKGWVGMTGLILMLHFGLFQWISCAWRAMGVQARPLMNRPLSSTSVSEFWGKRWNTAFRDLTHRFLFRPLTNRLGPRGAIAAGFLFSGVVHDIVISLPSGGGYGLPTLFFVIQGAALLAERSAAGKGLGLGRGTGGWLFTMLVLLVPAFGLFHPPFVRNIILPFMRALGAV
jgi:hypothetical protein